MEFSSVRQFIDAHREVVLRKWMDLWNGIQRRRPQSPFPDPPYAAILQEIPYVASVSRDIQREIATWIQSSPMFCVGAAFCQLHVAVAECLHQKATPDGDRLLRELERSVESLMLDAGTRKWIGALVADDERQETLHAERLAVVGQLAAGVAHEIGNPLASISSIVQLLQRTHEKDSALAPQLDSINRSIDRIGRIVRDLVDFSRPVPEATAPLRVNELLDTALHLIRYDRRAKRISFAQDHAHEQPVIVGVQDQLTQVFINLLINAVDAIGEAGGTITTRTWIDADSVGISVQDTGNGIPSRILPRIFDPFFTTKPVGKGTGLGLSVSYGIVKRHHGRIDVHSESGQGTTFTVTFPSASDHPQPGRP